MYDNIFQKPHMKGLSIHPVFELWSKIDQSSSNSSTNSNYVSFFAQDPTLNTLKKRINERDVYGYTLLHYAAILGDDVLCERLLAAGADANLLYYDDTLPLSECKKTPLSLALAYGHSKVADRLLIVTNKAGISSSHLGDCQSKESSQWYKNSLKKSLLTSYPGCLEGNWTFITPSIFFKEATIPVKSDESDNEDILFAFEKFSDLIYRLCELGEIDLLRKLLSPWLEKLKTANNDENDAFLAQFKEWHLAQKFGDFPEEKNCLHAAVCSGSIETVEFLLSQDICALNAPRTKEGQLNAYPTTALMMAVLQKNSAMVQTLLSKGARVNDQDKKQWTPLMMAMMTGDFPTIRLLWESAPPETRALKNMDGQNFLHIAAQYANNVLIWDYLRNQLGSEFEAQMRIPDKYGFSALDWALFQKNTAALNSDKTQQSQFQKDPRYGNFPTSTQQLKIEKKIQYYFKLKGRDLNFLAKEDGDEDALHGLCNGMIFLKPYYNKKIKRDKKTNDDYFTYVLKKISAWDGTLKSLQQPFLETEPYFDAFKAAGYRNLEDLMEQWTNDLIYFWGNGRFEPDVDVFNRADSFEKMRPNEYHENITAIHTLHNDQSKLTHIASSKKLNPWLRKTKEELTEIIQYFSMLPIESTVEIADSGHITEITFGKNSIDDCYDPNQFYTLAPDITPESAAQHIYDYLHVRRRTESIKQLDEKPKKLHSETKAYIFASKDTSTDVPEINLFKQKGTPNTAAETQTFQQKSANRFTPLHIATMLQQNKYLQSLLKNTAHDVNAVDTRGFTPLTLALLMNNEPGACLLFQQPSLSLPNLLENIQHTILLDKPSAFQAGLKAITQRQIIPKDEPTIIQELVLCLKSIQNTYLNQPEKRLIYLKAFLEILPTDITTRVLNTALLKVPFNNHCLIEAFKAAKTYPTARCEELNLLLKAGADLFFIDPKNPLMCSAPIELSATNLKDPKELIVFNTIVSQLKQKDHLDKHDIKGNAILHYAVKALNEGAISCLLDAGAKLMHKDTQRKTVFDLLLAKIESTKSTCLEETSYQKCVDLLFTQATKDYSSLSKEEETTLNETSKKIMGHYEDKKIPHDKWPPAFSSYCQRQCLQSNNFNL